MKIQQTIKYLDDFTTMKGNEQYPIIGNKITKAEVEMVSSRFNGLLLVGHCLLKAMWVQQYLEQNRDDIFTIILGKLSIVDRNNNTSYGFYFNPPLEYHAWVRSFKEKAIYDLSLPGAIIKGLNTSDDQGPFLKNIKPSILATGIGHVPTWLRYTAYRTFKKGDKL